MITLKTKWTLFWILCAAFICGILSVCGLVSAVNWLGSEKFCSTGCHTMNGVAYAWKQGSHARTASGKTADCSDCHLYNASENTLGPIGYISLLGHKVVAASHSAFGQIIGNFSTPTLWMQQRPGIEAGEIQWFRETNYHTCRGCHDLSRMWDKNKPSIGAWHALYQNQTLDCLACHKDVGHNYTKIDAYIKDNGTYPNLDEAWLFPVDASSSASPMPPANLTPEQLQKDAQPYNPSSVSGASTSNTQTVNQSKDAAQIAQELYQKTKEPIDASSNTVKLAPAATPAQSVSGASTPAAKPASASVPPPAPKAAPTQAVSGASSQKK